MPWYIRPNGFAGRPIRFDTEDEARTWATDCCPNGGYEIIETTDEIGTFEDVPYIPPEEDGPATPN